MSIKIVLKVRKTLLAKQHLQIKGLLLTVCGVQEVEELIEKYSSAVIITDDILGYDRVLSVLLLAPKKENYQGVLKLVIRKGLSESIYCSFVGLYLKSLNKQIFIDSENLNLECYTILTKIL
jgi:hypothetical protein